ncbi:hypothetical protein DICSQDRAFT_156150 [Dichomitus squalens LYAD-421 SS1]|uniref:Uncharacterized protein n=1 Tax=Dichomitus squalens (strain LYAD-421) TaxID=732165 RepID=R7SUL7_DICSQ|nr:uncharacterized protein DICSQDRAFT_156150 [Dichomitus squalens LYAD-421 SS1]EJF59608.1 hypothetical protein DICSQDRAFT_156150 [Dichomitus squalens LYAD-421 SS1]
MRVAHEREGNSRLARPTVNVLCQSSRSLRHNVSLGSVAWPTSEMAAVFHSGPQLYLPICA